MEPETMRQRYWLFLVSVLLFVGGIGFIIAAERTRRETGTRTEPPTNVRAAPALATVKQLMVGLIQPSAEHVWDAISVTVTEKGVDEKQPRTDEEWALVETSAVMLVESATLLLEGNRDPGGDVWSKAAKDMAEASALTANAARARNKDEVFKLGETIYRASTDCHATYLRQ
jgi:hypothetical protein